MSVTPIKRTNGNNAFSRKDKHESHQYRSAVTKDHYPTLFQRTFFPHFFFSSLSTTLVNGHILALTLTGWLPCSIQPFIYLPIYSGKGPRKVKRNKPRIFDIERDSGIYEGSSFAASSFRRTSRSTSIYLCNTSSKDVMEQVPVPPREKGGFHFILTERTFNPGFSTVCVKQKG